MKNLLKTAILAATEAGQEILKIYENPIAVEIKDDNSPLTLADKHANTVINHHLEPLGIPIISEENKQTAYEVRKGWNRCWIVDPLDGTKEFIKRNGEFTVNIALVEDGKPVLGVIYVPVTKELYVGDVKSKKAWKITVDGDTDYLASLNDENEIKPSSSRSKNVVRVVGSRSHMSDDTLNYIEELKKEYKNVEIVSKGSSLKFCLVAEGEADVYPRFAPTMEWDTAAGQAICKAVGLDVIDKGTGKPMVYNRQNLLNNHFLVK